MCSKLQAALWQAHGKWVGRVALKKSYQHGLDSDMHAPAPARSSGVCGRDKEKIMRRKSEKSAFSRKPLAEPWTQTLDISNDFQEIQQADLFSYVKSQGITDKSKAGKKALFPTPTRRWEFRSPQAGGFIAQSVVFPTHPAHEAVSSARDFVTLPAAKRAAHSHAIPHHPAREHAHHQRSDQHRHQRGDVMALQPVPEEHNEPAKDSASDDRSEKAENKMARGTHATP